MALIDGVLLTPLKIIPDERGQVMHVLRSDAPHFKQFGETYISVIYPNVTKGWKLHSSMTSNMAVPVGRVKFVLFDTREGSPTKGQFQEVYLGDNNYQLLTAPAGVAYAWKNLLPISAYVVNCATEPHRPEEARMIPFHEVPYQWE
ncbi:MAG: dTDP-4-dehydrorhamnose 3,5-epimerase family protein [Patescibacteria group bacterium]